MYLACVSCRHADCKTCPLLGNTHLDPNTYHCCHWAPVFATGAGLWKAYKLARFNYQYAGLMNRDKDALRSTAERLYVEWLFITGQDTEKTPDLDYRRPVRNYEATAADVQPGQYVRWYGPNSCGHQVVSVEHTCNCNAPAKHIDPKTGKPMHHLVVVLTYDKGGVGVLSPQSPVTITNQMYGA